MAYDPQSMTRLGSVPLSAGRAISKYLYASTDDHATVKASAYFNADAKRLRKGDQIDCTLSAGGTPTTTQLVVTSADGVTPVTTAVAIFT